VRDGERSIKVQKGTKMKVVGRVPAIASFRFEALFTSFARQTNEAENSPERETLRFRVRFRPKKRSPRCVLPPLRHPPRAVLGRADSVGSLDFCLSSVFCSELLYLNTFFRPAVAQRERVYVSVCNSTGSRGERWYHRCGKELTNGHIG